MNIDETCCFSQNPFSKRKPTPDILIEVKKKKISPLSPLMGIGHYMSLVNINDFTEHEHKVTVTAKDETKTTLRNNDPHTSLPGNRSG